MKKARDELRAAEGIPMSPTGKVSGRVKVKKARTVKKMKEVRARIILGRRYVLGCGGDGMGGDMEVARGVGGQKSGFVGACHMCR